MKTGSYGTRHFGRLVMILTLSAVAASGSAGSQAKQSERTKAIWETAIERMNRQSDAWYEDGDFPKCIQNLRLTHLLSPDDYEVATNLGWMLENVHEWDEALSVYVNYRVRHPSDPDAAWPEANFYFMQKAYAKVPPILEPSIKSARAIHPNVFRTLAHAYDKLGLLKDAKRVWEDLLKHYPDDQAAQSNLKRVSNKISGIGKPARK